MEDASHTLWIGTEDGLNRYDRRTETFTRYLQDTAVSTKLHAPRVLSILEDHSGTLWVGNWSGNGGLFKFHRETETFTDYFHDPDDPNSLAGNSIRWIVEDDAGRLWLCLQTSGLNRFDPQTETVTHYAHEPVDPHSIGAFKIDRKPRNFSHYTHHPENANSLSENNINLLYEDRQGRFWVGTRDTGLDRFDPETETFTHFKHDPDDPTSSSNDMVQAIHQDRFGALWVGTQAGLNKLVPSTSSGQAPSEAEGKRSGQTSSLAGALYGGSAPFPPRVRYPCVLARHRLQPRPSQRQAARIDGLFHPRVHPHRAPEARRTASPPKRRQRHGSRLRGGLSTVCRISPASSGSSSAPPRGSMQARPNSPENRSFSVPYPSFHRRHRRSTAPSESAGRLRSG